MRSAEGAATRLSGWRLAAVRVAVAAVVGLNLIGLYVLLGATKSAGSGAPSFFDAGFFPLMLAGAVISALAACMVATALAVRTRGDRAALSLALSMALFAFCSIGLISVIGPWERPEGVGADLLARAVTLLPALAIVATAAFLRFAVLFPRPLTASELSRLRHAKPDDSLGRVDRFLDRLAGSAFGGDRTEGAGSRRARPFGARLAERVPDRLRQWAARPVVVDSGRLLTEPKRLWSLAALAALAPYVVWWAAEVVPPLIGVEIRSTDPAAWVAAGTLLVWLTLIPGGVILAVAALRLGYAAAKDADRRRMRWIIESLNATLWIMIAMVPFQVLEAVGVDNPVVRVLPGIDFGLLPLILVTGFAVAIFYDGALEPSLVVRRSTLYGLFGFLLAFVFAVVEELVTEHVAQRLGLPGGTGTLVASGVIAAGFGGFYGRFNRRVARYLKEEDPALAPRRHESGIG